MTPTDDLSPAEDLASVAVKVLKGDSKAKKGFWRSNIEAFTVAIVFALIIKTFLYPAFQVPTESMEPTIIGRTPGGDRILVNQFVYSLRDPERFEVVVFRYPMARLVNYVKRLVGLPGETLRIAHGDLYVSTDGVSFEVTRKTQELAETMFLNNPVIPEEVIEHITSTSFRKWWDFARGKINFDSDEGELTLKAGNAAVLVTTQNAIKPERQDRDAATRDGQSDATISDPVGDLRLDLHVTPAKGVKTVELQILDGTQPRMALKLSLAVEGGDATSKLLHGKQAVGGSDWTKVSIPAGDESEISFQNCDDRVTLIIDGEEVARYDYIQSYETRTNQGVSSVKFGLSNGEALVRHVAVYRDIYYTVANPAVTTFTIPDEHYLFFGDNSPNSLDARGWRVVGIRLRESGKILLGDFEAVSDSFDWPRRNNNPYFATTTTLQGKRKVDTGIVDESVHHFLDIMGNEWDLKSGSYDILDLQEFDEPDAEFMALHQTSLKNPREEQIGIEAMTTPLLKEKTYGHDEKRGAFKNFSRLMHFVRRDDVLGQANLIFWPLSRMGVIR